ncbi:hypothetical protein [Propionispira raffinosivorans]|uniref:hypothetical protein n=1 Tax=Propionispira raffinosivorans TaxID=86959 RepID=UPI000367CE34|nr:hypothetical protein [Propionispira raffinosivorans]
MCCKVKGGDPLISVDVSVITSAEFRLFSIAGDKEQDDNSGMNRAKKCERRDDFN